MNRCSNCPHGPRKHGGTGRCLVERCTCTGWEPVRRLGIPVPDELKPDWANRYCPHPRMVLGESCPMCGRVVGSEADMAVGRG